MGFNVVLKQSCNGREYLRKNYGNALHSSFHFRWISSISKCCMIFITLHLLQTYSILPPNRTPLPAMPVSRLVLYRLAVEVKPCFVYSDPTLQVDHTWNTSRALPRELNLTFEKLIFQSFSAFSVSELRFYNMLYAKYQC